MYQYSHLEYNIDKVKKPTLVDIDKKYWRMNQSYKRPFLKGETKGNIGHLSKNHNYEKYY